MQSEEQRKKSEEKSTVSEKCGTSLSILTYTIYEYQKEKREKKQKNMWRKIAERFLNSMKNNKQHIQEVKWTPSIQMERGSQQTHNSKIAESQRQGENFKNKKSNLLPTRGLW